MLMSAKSGSDLYRNGTGLFLPAGMPFMQRWECALAREMRRSILQACPLVPMMSMTGQFKHSSLTATWRAGPAAGDAVPPQRDMKGNGSADMRLCTRATEIGKYATCIEGYHPDPNGSLCYRKAWKRAALETHPDKTGQSEPFIRVSQAYTLLVGAC